MDLSMALKGYSQNVFIFQIEALGIKEREGKKRRRKKELFI